ncbi:MAG: T9SS type A sorting domain-containing protein [Ignavibacteriales bacterium]|nr:T9SS type A sorting domain-containing protein [Ignavibacteriales bacterium]
MKNNCKSRVEKFSLYVFVLIALQLIISINTNAQGCGTSYTTGGAQGGGYASGGNAQYVPTASTDTMYPSGRWNMVSVARVVEDFTPNVLFPSAISKPFWFKGGYTIKSILKNGEGYWLKFPPSQEIPISGYDLTTIAIPVDEGWNMIGTISVPLPTSSIISDPPGMITSQFFGYDSGGGYHHYDTLLPNKGMWIKVSNPGTLILSTSNTPEMLTKNAIKVVPTNELPPPPPDGSVINEVGIPNEYALGQAYPNPFNPSTCIKYELPSDSKISLKIYDLLGQVIAILKEGIEQSGYKSVEWNASSVSSGIYFYKLEATSITDPGKSFMQVKKMILLK